MQVEIWNLVIILC